MKIISICDMFQRNHISKIDEYERMKFGKKLYTVWDRSSGETHHQKGFGYYFKIKYTKDNKQFKFWPSNIYFDHVL